MSIIIRIVIIAACAYAGSAIAGAQFRDLHDHHQIAQKTNMKKPTLQIQEQQPRNIQRADIAPVNGFALVVDGHFKTEFGSDTAAQDAAKGLLTKLPKLTSFNL